jgi:hypothetical protein
VSKKEEVEKLVEFAFRDWVGLGRTESGFWEGSRDSTFLRVAIREDGERISFLSPIGFEIPRSGELAWDILVAHSNKTIPFVIWDALSGDTNRCNVWRRYSRSTDGLDAEEIEELANLVVGSADDDDDAFVAKFGGRTALESDGSDA